MSDEKAARLRINRKSGEILNVFTLMAQEQREVTVWPAGDFCSESLKAVIKEVDLKKRVYTVELLSEVNFLDYKKDQTLYIHEAKDNILFKVIINNLENSSGQFQIPYEIREVEKRKFDRYSVAESAFAILSLDDDSEIKVKLSNVSQGGIRAIVCAEEFARIKCAKRISLEQVNGFELKEKHKMNLVHFHKCLCIHEHKSEISIGLKFIRDLDTQQFRAYFALD